MAFLTALLTGLGGYGAGRQQSIQNKQNQEQITSQTDYEKAEAEQAKQDAQIRAAQAGYQMGPTGLQPIPLKGTYAQAGPNTTPEQAYNLAVKNYLTAQSRNDQVGMQQWGDAVTRLSTGFNKVAGGEYDIQGRIPLAQAQTAWWKQKHSEVMAALQARLGIAGANRAAANARASLSAGTRLQVAQMGEDAREFVVMQTALNQANGMQAQQAQTAALEQYKAANSNWQLQQREYASGDAGVANPGAPPQPQQFGITVNTQSAQPSIIMVPVPQANGTVKMTPTVVRHSGGMSIPQTGDPKVSRFIQQATEAKTPKEQIPGYVAESVSKGTMTQAEGNQILKHFGVSPATPPHLNLFNPSGNSFLPPLKP